MRDFTDSHRGSALAFILPVVREAWLRAKLAEFDRLTGKGMSDTKAARRLGLSDVSALRRNVNRFPARHFAGGRQ